MIDDMCDYRAKKTYDGVGCALTTDLNHDGIQEVVIGGDGYLHVRHDGLTLWAQYSADSIDGRDFNVVRVATGDIDGDGIDEIVASDDNRRVYAFDFDVAGTISLLWYRDLEDAVVGVYDIDGDLKAEVIVHEGAGEQLYVLDRDGNTISSLVVGRGPRWMVIADLENDCLPEIVLGSNDNLCRAYEVRMLGAEIVAEESGLTRTSPIVLAPDVSDLLDVPSQTSVFAYAHLRCASDGGIYYLAAAVTDCQGNVIVPDVQGVWFLWQGTGYAAGSTFPADGVTRGAYWAFVAPTQLGTYCVRLQVLSAIGEEVDSQEFKLLVSSIDLVLLAPNGGETWSGVNDIRWTATASSGESLFVDIEISSDGGQSWTLVGHRELNDGLFCWDSSSWPIGDQYLVRITADNGSYGVSQQSATVFSVVRPRVLDHIQIEGPLTVFKNLSEDYECRAFYSDDTEALREPQIWQAGCDYAEISATGLLTTSDAPINTPCEIMAVYTEDGVTKSSILLITIVAELARADFDQDADVDHDDYLLFELCASGPGIPVAPGCEARDLDNDSDVDQVDFSIFQRCLSGPGVPADPHCADLPPSAECAARVRDGRDGYENGNVWLDGTASTCAGGTQIVAYEWQQVGGTTVELSDANGPTPYFDTPPIWPACEMQLSFILRVSDGETWSAWSSPEVITVHLAGDANHDGLRNQADVDLITAHWGETCQLPCVAGLTGDVNGDGVVDLEDVMLVLGNCYNCLYVSPTGSAGGNGSPCNPYGDIQQAINAATSGGHIVLLPGTYSQAEIQVNKDVTIKGDPPLQAFVRGTGTETLFWVHANCQFFGLMLQNAADGIKDRYNSVSYQWTVQNCVVEDMSASGLMIGQEAARLGRGVWQNVIARNCTVGFATNDAEGYTAQNCAAVDCAIGFVSWNSSDTVSYCGCWNCGTCCDPAELCEEGMVYGDPLFIGGTPFDYHLQPGSPYIDAGEPSQTDADGSRIDIGAYGGM